MDVIFNYLTRYITDSHTIIYIYKTVIAVQFARFCLLFHVIIFSLCSWYEIFLSYTLKDVRNGQQIGAFYPKSFFLSNVGSMLVHCLRRWPNIDPAFDEKSLFAGTSVISPCKCYKRNGIPSKQEPFIQFRINVGPATWAIGQHSSYIGSMACVCLDVSMPTCKFVISPCECYKRDGIPWKHYTFSLC